MKKTKQKDNGKRELLEESEISLILDNYDDIFSDFDPRPYSQRALSDDFLFEAKKAARSKASGGIELKFLVPAKLRNSKQEKIIKRRLRAHFNSHHQQQKDEMNRVIKYGLAFVFSGIMMMAITTYILVKFNYDEMSKSMNLLTHFLIVLLEPAGWFMFWEGMNHAIFESRKTKPELDFYEKMRKCAISFISY